MKINFLTGLILLCLNFNVYGNQFGYESHEVFVTEVSESYKNTYQDVLSQYDAHILQNPDDVLALTEKCQFIEIYSYAESDLIYFESLSDDLTECNAQVEEHPENHPDRLLYELTRLWGEEATEKYDEIYNSGIDEWTHLQKVRFFQWMENTQKWSSEYDPDIPHNAYLETNDPQFALGAAIYELESGNKNKALELLEYQQAKVIQDRMKLANLYVDLGLTDKAKGVLANFEDESGVNDIEVIKMKSSIDDEYSPTIGQIIKIKEAWNGDANLQELFGHAIDIESYHLAKIIYQTWTSGDIWTDPFKYHKFKLYKASGQWNWNIQDFYAVLIWVAVVVICFIISFIVIAPVHYRGLYRRVHNKKPLESLTNWNLKHALFLATIFSLAGTVLYIVYQYDSFYSTFFMDEEMPFSSENGLNSKIYFINAVVMLIMSLLIFKHGKSLFKVSSLGFLKSLIIAVGVFVIFKFFIVAGMFAMKLSTLSAAFDIVKLTISDIYSNYGTLITFLTIAFLTPLIEEYLFRGVLLNSFTKHITFGWANIIQSGIFSLIHESHYIHHFIFGLIVGYFVKAQKHLYGAIIFHMINNALAVSVLVS